MEKKAMTEKQYALIIKLNEESDMIEGGHVHDDVVNAINANKSNVSSWIASKAIEKMIEYNKLTQRAYRYRGGLPASIEMAILGACDEFEWLLNQIENSKL